MKIPAKIFISYSSYVAPVNQAWHKIWQLLTPWHPAAFGDFREKNM